MQYSVIKTEPQVRFASCIKSVQHLAFACAPLTASIVLTVEIAIWLQASHLFDW